MAQLAPVATSTPTRCPRCRGPMFPEFDGVREGLLCLYCGEYVFPNTRSRAHHDDRSTPLAGIVKARAPAH